MMPTVRATVSACFYLHMQDERILPVGGVAARRRQVQLRPNQSCVRCAIVHQDPALYQNRHRVVCQDILQIRVKVQRGHVFGRVVSSRANQERGGQVWSQALENEVSQAGKRINFWKLVQVPTYVNVESFYFSLLAWATRLLLSW